MAKRKTAPPEFQSLTISPGVEFVMLSPHRLIPNDYNPNEMDDNSFRVLKNSIEDNGFSVPIVAQKKTLVVIDGFHRRKAAIEMGIDPVPVFLLDKTDAEARVATIEFNTRGHENRDLMGQMLKQLDEMGSLDWAKERLRRSDEEISILLAGFQDQPSIEIPEPGDVDFPEEDEEDDVYNLRLSYKGEDAQVMRSFLGSNSNAIKRVKEMAEYYISEGMTFS